MSNESRWGLWDCIVAALVFHFAVFYGRTSAGMGADEAAGKMLGAFAVNVALILLCRWLAGFRVVRKERVQ